MNRFLNLLEFSLVSLLRRWKKQLALVIIYSLVVGFFASVVFFTAALKYETTAVLENIPELWIQKLAGGRLIPIKETFIKKIEGFRGVKKIMPRIWGYLYDSPTGAVFSVIGMDSTFADLGLINTQFKGTLGENAALCGTGFIQERGMDLGDRLTIQDSQGELRSYDIVGTFDAASDLLTKDLIVLSSKNARIVLGLNPNEYTDIALSIHNPAEVENIARKIDQQNSGIRVVSKAQLSSTYETLFSWRGGIFVYGSILSIMAFLILAWDKAAGLSKEERKELGILKGVGWQINDVLLVKLLEGCIQSFSATLLGIVFAFIHVFWLQAPLLKPFLIGWSVLYPDYNLIPVLNPGDIMTIIALAVIPYLSASLIPSWLAAITDPAESLT